MNDPICIQIIGTRVACSGGYQDSWRETARWAAGQVHRMFGDSARVEYYDLFDPDCPALPAHVQLPVVLISGELLSSGQKISMPAIRKKLVELGLQVQTGAGSIA